MKVVVSIIAVLMTIVTIVSIEVVSMIEVNKHYTSNGYEQVEECGEILWKKEETIEYRFEPTVPSAPDVPQDDGTFMFMVPDGEGNLQMLPLPGMGTY